MDPLALLEKAHVIAVVGLSDSPAATSHRIGRYLIDAGFTVVPVNPQHEQVLGLTSYPDVNSIPDTFAVDIVNIFRRPRFTADMVRSAVDYAERTGRKPAVWTQLGVSSDEAERLTTEAGLPYVRNRCIMVEHARGQAGEAW